MPTSTTIYLNELESAARFLKAELGQALNSVLAGDYDELEAFLRRAALASDAICESARRAREAQMRQAELFEREAA